MNPVLKEKWVAALRSGQYKQGKKCLRTYKNTFCCLGVLVDIAYPKRWERSVGSFSYSGNRTDLLDTDLELPEFCQEKLIIMNDGMGEKPKTFLEIATWIEENL